MEKSTGQRYAVKIFTKIAGMEEKSKTEGLQQEIGVLMGVSHPNVLCLKDTFNERDRVYLVLELAAEGELFNFIVMKQKLSEDESRKLFIQLFQGIKYLVSIVHSHDSWHFPLTHPSARTKHCTQRHQAREYSAHRQEFACQACGLWSGQNYRRRVLYDYAVRHPKLRCA